MADAKVRNKASEVMRQEKQAKVDELEALFKVKVDLSNVSLGDLSDLTKSDIPFERRMEIIQGMLSEGDARNIKILQLQSFMDLITTKLDLESNPTSGASTDGK